MVDGNLVGTITGMRGHLDCYMVDLAVPGRSDTVCVAVLDPEAGLDLCLLADTINTALAFDPYGGSMVGMRISIPVEDEGDYHEVTPAQVTRLSYPRGYRRNVLVSRLRIALGIRQGWSLRDRILGRRHADADLVF